MDSLLEVIEFHSRRGSLSEYPAIAKLATALESARQSMAATIEAEETQRQARLERELIRPFPMPSAPAAVDDVCVYSFTGALPRFDNFTQGSLTYEFTHAAGQALVIVPAALAHVIPPQSPGWTATPAREMFSRPDLLGGELIRMLSSVPLCIALFNRLSGSSGEQAKLASQLLRSRCAELGRDPTEHATPMASFARAWAAQDAQAEKISNMLFTARDGETLEQIPGDLTETQMRLSAAQVRASNMPDAIAARTSKFFERDQLLEQISADLRSIKENASTNSTETP